MAGGGDADALSQDAAAVGLNADDAPLGTGQEARDLAVLDDVHPERIGGTRVAPGYGVVPRRAGAPLAEAAQHGEAGVGRHVKERRARRDLPAREDLGVYAVPAHGILPARHRV